MWLGQGPARRRCYRPLATLAEQQYVHTLDCRDTTVYTHRSGRPVWTPTWANVKQTSLRTFVCLNRWTTASSYWDKLLEIFLSVDVRSYSRSHQNAPLPSFCDSSRATPSSPSNAGSGVITPSGERSITPSHQLSPTERPSGAPSMISRLTTSETASNQCVVRCVTSTTMPVNSS